MIHPLLAMALALTVLVALTALLRLLQKRFRTHPEVIRKCLHAGMGLTVLPFPWIFHHSWPVLVLSAISLAGLLILRLGRFRANVGSVVGGVSRVSWGEFCFPISVAILFYIHSSPLRFVIPILILTLADATAALIGITYGRLHYASDDGTKSAEGSLAFFIVAFFSVHLPLLLCTSVGRAETLLIALMLGLLVMLMEAIAWRGLDNLFIPIGAYALLARYLPLGVGDLLLRLGVTVGLLLFVIIFRKRSTLTPTALVSAALFGYATFALGGLLWMIAPWILFLCLWAFWPKSEANTSRHDVQTVFATAGPGLFWLALRVISSNDALLLPFITLFSAHLALIGASWLPLRAWHPGKVLRLARAIGAAALLPPILYGAARLAILAFPAYASRPAIGVLLASPELFFLWNLAAVGLVAILFTLILPRLLDPHTHRFTRIHHVGGLLAFAASAVVALLAQGLAL